MAKNNDLIPCLFFFFIKSLKMPPGPARSMAGAVSTSGRDAPNHGYNEVNGKKTIKPSRSIPGRDRQRSSRRHFRTNTRFPAKSGHRRTRNEPVR